MSCAIKGFLLAIAVVLSNSGQAGIFELRGNAVAETLSFECEQWGQPESIFCLAGFHSLGQPGVLSFFVDTGTRITDPYARQSLLSSQVGDQPHHLFGAWEVNGIGMEYQGLPFSGVNYEASDLDDDFARIEFSMGETHGMGFYGHTHEELGGYAWLSLSDSSGTALAGVDLLSHDAVDDWLVNHFDLSLFDSGTWWVATFDGGGGAAGRFAVPGPSSMALLGIGLLLLGIAGRRRLRSEKRRGQA